MKLKIRLLKTTITFIISMLFIALVIFFMFFKFFITFPWEIICYILLFSWLLGAIVFYIITIKFNYYILHKKYFVVKKYKKELVYNFSEILYIDEEQSEKSKTICFVTDKLHVRYLTFDKEGVLYEAMLHKCSNRLDKETFKERYPNIKI